MFYIIIIVCNFPDGQKIAKKLCLQISKETTSLKSLVREYNACGSTDDVSNDVITISEVLDPSNAEIRLARFGSWYKTVATGDKRQIIDAYLVLCRCEEEGCMLKREATNLVLFYEEIKKCILAELSKLSNDGDSYIRGAFAMLNQLFQRNQVLLNHSNEVKDSFTRDSEDILSHIELLRV